MRYAARIGSTNGCFALEDAELGDAAQFRGAFVFAAAGQRSRAGLAGPGDGCCVWAGTPVESSADEG